MNGRTGPRFSSARRRRAWRRGHSLTELMTVVVIVSVVLSSLGTTWHLLGRTQSKVNREIDQRRQVDRLAYRLRLDARDASTAQAITAGWNLTSPAGQVVEYRVLPSGIERRLRQGDQITHRDLFRLSDLGQVDFLPPSSPASPAKLVLSRKPADVPWLELHVALGGAIGGTP